MQAAQEPDSERFVFCETHGKRCCVAQASEKCPCCGKRVCLCNYIL